MKRSLKGMLFAAACALAVGLSGSAANATTTVNTTWAGGGQVNSSGSSTNGSSYAFSAGGNFNFGSATYTNDEDNPYGYAVPTTQFDGTAQVGGGTGGVITSTVDRNGSYAGLYGTAGQSISSEAYTSDGTAALVTNATVNYASLEDLGHYGVTQTPDNNTIEATGSVIQLVYNVNTGAANNGGGITLNGSGSGSLTQNFAGASAGGFQLGVGGGDYQLANVSAQGIGQIQTGGAATSSLGVTASNSTIYGTPTNPASITTTINYDTSNAGGALQTYNYGITGNTN